MGWKYTEEMLREAVASSRSFAEVLRYLGIVESGGNHSHISRTIRRMNIDTSHFLGRGWSRGRETGRRVPPEERLVLGRPGQPRVNGEKLRKALLAIGRAYLCAACGNRGTWLFQPLSLHVDHINGKYWDNRRENLRFLCPNCHAVTATHSGRNRLSVRRAIQQQDELAGSSGGQATRAANDSASSS